MKRFLTIAALVLVALQTSAQRDYKFTAKLGVGLSSVVGRNADTKVFVAAKAGLSYDLKLFGNLYLIPEVDFDLKGFNPKYVNNFTRDKAILMAYVQGTPHVAYKFRLNEGRNIVLKAGPYFAYGVVGSSVNVTDFWSSYEADIFDGIRRFDMGVHAGLAYERNHFSFGLEYSRGLRSLAPDVSIYNQAFGLVLGYKF